VNGNIAVDALGLANKRPFACCPEKAVSAVVTINRVQDVYNNPVYTCQMGSTGAASDLPSKVSTASEKTTSNQLDLKKEGDSDDQGGVQQLDRLFWDGRELSLESYRSLNLTSVHIGHLLLANKKS